MSVYLDRATESTTAKYVMSNDCSKSEMLHMLEVEHECRLFGCPGTNDEIPNKEMFLKLIAERDLGIIQS